MSPQYVAEEDAGLIRGYIRVREPEVHVKEYPNLAEILGQVPEVGVEQLSDGFSETLGSLTSTEEEDDPGTPDLEVLSDTEDCLVSANGFHKPSVVQELPQLWRHDAKSMLDFARVGIECIREYRLYTAITDYDCDTTAPPSPIGPNDTANDIETEELLASHATDLINAILSLKGNHAWSMLVIWLRDKVEGEISEDTMEMFFEYEDPDWLKRLRTLSGSDWNFMHFADTQWGGQLAYIVLNLEEILPHLSDPSASDLHFVEGSEELRYRESKDSSPAVGARSESQPLMINPAPVLGLRRTYHFQLPTKASMARANAPAVAKAVKTELFLPKGSLMCDEGKAI